VGVAEPSLLALFGPDAPDWRCPVIGEERKFSRCQSDAIEPHVGRYREMLVVS
jgi:hypothetical protein